MFVVKEYISLEGKNYFRIWIGDLEKSSKAKIQARIFRVLQGNLGNYKSLGGGVFELKIDFGPGFRVYFGKDGDRVIILLLGGDKSGQKNDIKKSKALWVEYLRRK